MRLETGRSKLIGLSLVLLLLLIAIAVASDSGVLESREGAANAVPIAGSRSVDAHSYNGYLRIYLTEIVSETYDDYSGNPYEYGFLNFIVNEPITLEYGDTIRETALYNGSLVGLTDADEDNIAVLGAVFNGKGYPANSDTVGAHSYPYTAYYVDASVSTESGETDIDTASAPYAHSVFIEEGTSPT